MWIPVYVAQPRQALEPTSNHTCGEGKILPYSVRGTSKVP